MTKKKKITTIIVSSLSVLLIASTIGLLVSGYKYGIPPFGALKDERLKKLEGNGEAYSLEEVKELPSSPIKGDKVAYLGSSVTYGASSLGTSFVEYISKRNNNPYIKEAVSGTTLADINDSSYVKRLTNIDKKKEIDIFVCQLSTNDASKKIELGDISSTDTKTTCGAINYIIDYVHKTWGSLLLFYTNSYYENSYYKQSVYALNEIAKKKYISVIDLYSDEEFNNISEKKRSLYMEDNIHPTKAGYLKWWTPKMEKGIYDFVERSKEAF